MKEAAPFIAFGVVVVLIRLQNRGRPAPYGLAGLPPRARIALLAAWVLGFVGIVGASFDEAFAVALLPGGLLLILTAVWLRGYQSPDRRVPTWLFPVGTGIIGVGWTAVGVLQAIDLLS
jgi:hypothetical protein